MSASVRPARASERAEAVALWLALHREHETLDPRYRLADDAALRWGHDFDDWVRSDLDAVLVAEAAEGLVGLLVAHVAVAGPVYQPARFVYVDDLYVAPSHRRRGLGAALVTAVAAWGERHEAPGVRAGVLATNAAARRFWAQMGASDYAVTVVRPG